jgi:hypothetical protein
LRDRLCDGLLAPLVSRIRWLRWPGLEAQARAGVVGRLQTASPSLRGYGGRHHAGERQGGERHRHDRERALAGQAADE